MKERGRREAPSGNSPPEARRARVVERSVERAVSMLGGQLLGDAVPLHRLLGSAS